MADGTPSGTATAEGGGTGNGGVVEAYIALGSNLGDSVGVMEAVLDRLRAWSDRPLRCSSFWRSRPVDCPPGSAWFVNAVVALRPRAHETPESLLEKLQALEREFGRRPKRVLNEPRPLDLDLIAYGDEVRSTMDLTLPHPRAHQRGFVLAPLREVAGEMVLPGQLRSVEELLLNLGALDGLERMPVAG
jgi:2-amino-4-hydroxy-6-hydroxymethyldihydropteridine diphosphokinase